MFKTTLADFFSTNNSNIVDFNSCEIAKSGGVRDVGGDNGKVENMSKAQNIKKLAKSKKTCKNYSQWSL